MLGIEDAEHEETTPQATTHVITRLACSLVGSTQTIMIRPGTLVQKIYGIDEAIEKFRCNYGLNPHYCNTIEQGPMHIAAVDSDGEIRAIELANHPFFVGTLYLPQISSQANAPHPLFTAFLMAAKAFQVTDKKE